MKIVNRRVIWPLPILFSLSHGSAFAFQDIYEPDDNQAQAQVMISGDRTHQQHTLHTRDDEDWFKFYVNAGVYRFEANQVGTDIKLAIELYDAEGNSLKKSDEHSFSWKALAEGFYYAKATDTTSEEAASELTCRHQIQYELHLFKESAPEFNGTVQGVVTDALSGQLLEDAIVDSSDCRNDPVFNFPDGSYHLPTSSGVCELTAKRSGYKPLTCHLQIPKIFSIQRNLPLLPNDETVPAPLLSKTVYPHGDTLYAWFKAIGLPPQSCLRYYFGLFYPDGRAFIITDLNRLAPLDENDLPSWRGAQNVILDKPIGDDMPSGEYQLYILRMPEGIDAPLNNLDKGELGVKAFRIE